MDQVTRDKVALPLLLTMGFEELCYADPKILQKADRLTQYSEDCHEKPAFKPTRTLSYRINLITPGVPLHAPKGLVVLSGPASTSPWFPVNEIYPVLTSTDCPMLMVSASVVFFAPDGLLLVDTPLLKGCLVAFNGLCTRKNCLVIIMSFLSAWN